MPWFLEFPPIALISLWFDGRGDHRCYTRAAPIGDVSPYAGLKIVKKASNSRIFLGIFWEVAGFGVCWLVHEVGDGFGYLERVKVKPRFVVTGKRC